MYYSEFSRIKRMQKLLSKIAYISVGTDFLIAISTYLVINDVKFSSSALMISDYLDFALVAIAAIMFVLLVLMKLQGHFAERARRMVFRMTH